MYPKFLGWLFLAVPIEVILAIVKILKLVQITEDIDMLSMQAIFLECSIACLGAVIMFDLYTLYKGVSKLLRNDADT